MNNQASDQDSEQASKIGQIRDLLDQKNLDALLLQRVSSFAWATCGADAHINTAASDGVAALLVTPHESTVFTNNIEALRLANEEKLADRGWLFNTSPWYENGNSLNKMINGMRLGSDGLYSHGTDLSKEIAWMRSQLTEQEVSRFRILGALCAQSMQAAVESVRPGMSEYQIAAQLAYAAESRDVQAIVNLVATDERIFSYRHPLPTAKELQRYAMLVLCGRKWGLVCSITRLVHFGSMDDEIRRKSKAVAAIDAVMISATRPGNTLADVFRQAQAAYAHQGFKDEWQMHHQGGLAGYEPREITATLDTNEPVRINQTYAWNPSISGAKSEDTILVGEFSNEILTEIPEWPMGKSALETSSSNGQPFLSEHENGITASALFFQQQAAIQTSVCIWRAQISKKIHSYLSGCSRRINV